MTRGPTVITVGNFDGVHVGHAELVRRVRAFASGQAASGNSGPARARVMALTFDPHPMTRLRPEAAPAPIMTFARRADLLRGLGVDDVVRIEPTVDVLDRTAEQFVRSVVEAYRPALFVEGADFRFGRGRTGDVRTLAEMGRQLGFAVEVVPPVEVVLEDHTIVAASSTLTRWLLRQGRVRDAAVMLGRPHELTGTVVSGDRRGRTIGFPTANLRTEDLKPASGVYAAVARAEDGREWPAAVNIGTRPTFSGIEMRVEAHLIEDDRTNRGSESRATQDKPAWAPLTGLPEYGWPLRLQLIGWVRDQVKFDSPARLVEQIGRDRARAAEMVREYVDRGEGSDVRPAAEVTA